jgi:hypothetical protein
LQEHFPNLAIQGNNISYFLSSFFRGGLDDIVPVDGLRVIHLIDFFIDAFEMIVEDPFVPIFVKLIKELIQFCEDQVIIILLDNGKELFFIVIVLLELEDVAYMLHQG